MTQDVSPVLVETYDLPLVGVATIPWRYLAASEHRVEWLAEGGVLEEALVGVDVAIAPDGDTQENVGVLSLLQPAPASATQIRLSRATTARQPYAAPPAALGVERAMDRLALALQEAAWWLARSLRSVAGPVPPVIPGPDGSVPLWAGGTITGGGPDAASIATAERNAAEAKRARDDILGSFADTEEALVAVDTDLLKTGLYSGSVWAWDPTITPAVYNTDPDGLYFVPPAPGENGAWTRNRKVFSAGEYPDTPAQDYTDVPRGNQLRLRWINGAGYQEPNTDGDLDGSYSPGKMPPGQSRLARTGSTQLYLHGTHSGFGDGYNINMFMAAVGHPSPELITRWSGQNSAGLMGGQVNALTDKVTEYGLGDLVLHDQGRTDIAQLGLTMILHRNGADSGDYMIPRYGAQILSAGNQPIDAAYIAAGKMRFGLDLSKAEATNDFQIVLPVGGRIAFAATPPGSGDGFVSVNPGTTYQYFDGTSLRSVVGNVPILQLTGATLTVNAYADSAVIQRLHGSSPTSFLGLGQFGNLSFISAASSGTDDTSLVFQTAAAGIEAEAMRINPQRAVILTPPSAPQTLTSNGMMTLEFTANDTITFRARGSDGNTRTATLTLT